MARRTSTKIKNMSPAAQQRRKDERHQADVEVIGAAIGLPEIQRHGHRVAIVDTPALANAGARVDKTVRKLTRADMLHRSGAIGKHHLEAISRYAVAAELAYGTTVRATQYGEGGGSSPTGSASAAHSRQLDRAYDADRYRGARKVIPGAYLAAFEAIVLENQQIGTVGEQMYPDLCAGKVSHNMRDLVRTCAECLCAHYGIESGDQRVHLAATMMRFDAAVRAQPARVTDALDELALRVAVEGGTGIIVSRSVLADIVRERKLDAEPDSHAGVPLFVNEGWQFGWMMSRAAA